MSLYPELFTSFSGRSCVDDPESIVRLVGQVVRVSLETVSIVNSLPAKYAESSSAS